MYKIDKVFPDVVHPLLTLKIEDRILSIVSIYNEFPTTMPNKNTYRFRGMAIEHSE